MSPYFLACAIDGCKKLVTPNRDPQPMGDFCDEHLEAQDRDSPPELEKLMEQYDRWMAEADNVCAAMERLLTKKRGMK